MKILYDFLPIALFFIAYKLEGIYVATVVAIVASLLQVGHFWYKNKRFEPMHLVSLGLILVLGGLTLVLRDKSFIMWKPTLVNWMFALAFLGTSLIGKKPLIQRMLGEQLSLPTNVWKRLNGLWIIFFLFTGSANLLLVKHYQAAELKLTNAITESSEQLAVDFDCETDVSAQHKSLCHEAKDREELWVNFKLFGMLGLTILFVILQGFYLAKYIEPDEPETNS